MPYSENVRNEAPRASQEATPNEIELSIVMPCLNEAETLATCIRKALGFIEKSGIRGEVIIGDNGSTDGSQKIAGDLGAKVVAVPLRGYGAALYYATCAARGRFVVMGDSDDSYDFANLQPFVDKLREGYDLVMGNRFSGGIKQGAMPWKNRYIGNPILSGIGRLLFRCPAQDFHCGLRGFSREAFAKMDLRTTGMEYASEMVIKSTLYGLRITEVPTTLSPDGRSRPPHLRPWRDGWRHLRFMLLYSPRWLFLYPGLVLMVLGLGIGLWLTPGPQTVGAVRFDIHTLLYAATALLVGYQSVVFGVLAKAFASAEGLLPKSRWLDLVLRKTGIEVGIGVGLLLLTVGVLGSVGATMSWQAAAFGTLDPHVVLRAVIPSATAATLGCETVLASLFLGVLRLRVRPQ